MRYGPPSRPGSHRQGLPDNSAFLNRMFARLFHTTNPSDDGRLNAPQELTGHQSTKATSWNTIAMSALALGIESKSKFASRRSSFRQAISRRRPAVATETFAGSAPSVEGWKKSPCCETGWSRNAGALGLDAGRRMEQREKKESSVPRSVPRVKLRRRRLRREAWKSVCSSLAMFPTA